MCVQLKRYNIRHKEKNYKVIKFNYRLERKI